MQALRRDAITWSNDIHDLCSDPAVPGIRMAHCSAGLIYIEPRYFYDVLRSKGFKRKRCDWVRDNFTRAIASGVPGDHFARGGKDDGVLAFDAMSTLAFVVLLFGMFNTSNRANNAPQCCAMATLHALSLHAICQLRLAPALPSIELVISHDDLQFRLVIDRIYGKVGGWGPLLESTPGAVELWHQCCIHRYYDTHVHSDYGAPLFPEVVEFCAIAKQSLSSTYGGSQIMVMVVSELAPILAQLFELRITELARTYVAPASGPTPPLMRQSSRPAFVDPFVSFNLLQRARELSTVPREVLRFNNDRAEYSQLRHHAADLWWLKELCMYVRNVVSAFTDVKQFSFAMDPSSYNGEETLVSQVYSHVVDKCVNATIKIVPKGKHIAVDEFPMTEKFAALCIQRKQERWAAFKELRATSAQLNDLTGGFEVDLPIV